VQARLGFRVQARFEEEPGISGSGREGAATQLDMKSHTRNNSAAVSKPPQQLKGGTVGESGHTETESENSGVTHWAHSAIRS